MDEEWAPIEEYANYDISSFGRVMNRDTGRIMRTSQTRTGVPKVGLVRSGVQSSRSIAVLVAETFVFGRTDIFDTPIHLDGDQSNNYAGNLVWRPRWFAWKYSHQFVEIDQFMGRGPLYDVESRVKYADIVQACVSNGLLFKEVRLALVSKERVFPTWQIFDWVR